MDSNLIERIRIQIRAIATTGLIIAFVLSFLMDAIFSVNGVARGLSLLGSFASFFSCYIP